MTKNGEKQDVGLAGKTVVIEKSGDGYTITVDGKEPTGVAADILKKEFKKEKNVNDEDLLPKDPVKVGGTWKVDLAMLAKDAEGQFEFDAAKSAATGKLIKVYDKGGKKFGVMEITIDLALTKIDGGGQSLEVKTGSKMKMSGTLDVCIDGTASTSSGKMAMTGNITATVMGTDVKVDLSATQEGTTEDAK
jgi:hypothetical protein